MKQWVSRYLLIIVLIITCVVIETSLFLADLNVLSQPRLRQTAYEFGGFWPGLWRDWSANYALQPYSMFISYGFLHGSLSHLIVNMITLWSFGAVAVDRVGQRRFMLLYLASLLGGALFYLMLNDGLVPMVGASGAIFGVIGGILSWSYVDLFAMDKRLWPIARAVGLLLLLNLALWWAMDGQLAWETHLGGFVFGWVFALIINPLPQNVDDKVQ